MALTRADLEKDLLRETFRKAHPGIPVLSDADQAASLGRILEEHPAGADVWIFGYGSLVWNPLVHYEERRVARLHGFHRSFCLWSHVNRGSMQKPGLVLGLDIGGSCRGGAVRVAHVNVAAWRRLPWRRGLVLGVYSPRWAAVEAGSETLKAIAFFANREHANYAGKLPLETVIKTLVSARGQLGTPAEYLLETVRGLVEHGVRDP